MTDTVGQQLVNALDEIEQLRGSKAALQVEIDRLRELNDELREESQHRLEMLQRLKAERHTTKRMLEDILYKHDQHYGLGRGGLRTVKPEER